MSSNKGEKEDFIKQLESCKLTQKCKTSTLNSDVCVDTQKESNQQKSYMKEIGGRQHKFNASPNSSRISQDFKEKNSSISNQALGWRDPGYKYERNTTPKNSHKDKGVYSRKERVGYSDSSAFKEKNSSYRRKESTDLNKEIRYVQKISSGNVFNETALNKVRYNDGVSGSGYWGLECYPDDEYADLEQIWAAVNQIYNENPELFVSKPTKSESFICCYAQDFKDVKQIQKVSDIIRQKLKNYPLLFYYYIQGNKKYLSTCDGDIYRMCTGATWGWKVVEI